MEMGRGNKDEKGEEPSDWRMKLAEWPIVKERMDKLDKCCEDIIPPFKPAFGF
jgi:hypothetical protein